MTKSRTNPAINYRGQALVYDVATDRWSTDILKLSYGTLPWIKREVDEVLGKEMGSGVGFKATRREHRKPPQDIMITSVDLSRHIVEFSLADEPGATYRSDINLVLPLEKEGRAEAIAKADALWIRRDELRAKASAARQNLKRVATANKVTGPRALAKLHPKGGDPVAVTLSDGRESLAASWRGAVIELDPANGFWTCPQYDVADSNLNSAKRAIDDILIEDIGEPIPVLVESLNEYGTIVSTTVEGFCIYDHYHERYSAKIGSKTQDAYVGVNGLRGELGPHPIADTPKVRAAIDAYIEAKAASDAAYAEAVAAWKAVSETAKADLAEIEALTQQAAA